MPQQDLHPLAAEAPVPASLRRWDVFCRVIDNHGDLGVCWRLGVELARRGAQVRLWIDDASALGWMAPRGEPGVQVLPWRDPLADDIPGDVVVEAFGCNPPAAFLARMATTAVTPVWINLEYLSAEAYVERSHGLCSPQWSGPATGLKKWFFYPGFTPGTGGLIHSAAPATPDRAAPVGAADNEQDLSILLFGYAQPALSGLLDACAHLPAGRGATVRVTPGWSASEVSRWLGQPFAAGQTCQQGSLRLVALPYLSQAAFDQQLARSDLNLVRGEDSLVAALWAARPLLWQLYVQDDGAHLDKLQAFLDVYTDADAPALLRPAFEAWNGARTWTAEHWSELLLALQPVSEAAIQPPWSSWSARRAQGLAQQQPDLVTALLAFAGTRAAESQF
jgi:uncharacterized repeat protein (TIGR03837 family)